MDGDPQLLERLRDAERAKRLLLLGAVAVFYAAHWLVFTHHGSPIGESECTVIRIYQGVHYTVTNVVDGVEYTASPGRIPESLGRPPVGSRVHCYYYRCDPSTAFFEQRRHPWPGPIPLAVLAAGLIACGEGLRRRLRSRQGPAAQPDSISPSAAPLEIPLAGMNWARSIVGGIFLFLTAVIVVLTTWLAWGSGGDVCTAALTFLLGCHAAMLASAFAVFYSSGLVFDADRGLLYFAWGLRRPWLRTYRPLATLVRVETRMSQYRRTRTYTLVLGFKDDRMWSYLLGYSLDQPFETEERIKRYLHL